MPLEIAPSTMAPTGPTVPQAGVTATRPATMPEAAPSIEALPRIIVSITHQAINAPAVAVKVFSMASTAPPVASRFEPALKPNQPTHRIEAPTMVNVIECGAIMSRPKPARLPTNRQPTSAAMPALMWTTVPPAKSSAPQLKIRPEPSHTMWAIGK